MRQNSVVAFEDPDRFQAAFRAGHYELLDLPRGKFLARLTQLSLNKAMIQRSDRAGAGTVLSASPARRISVMFLADAGQDAPRRNGKELSAHDLVVHRPGSTNHLLATGPTRLIMMSLEPEDLTAAGQAIAGCEIEAPSVTKFIRPDGRKLARLRALATAACTLAETTPRAFDDPAIAHSLEQQLIEAMIGCLAQQDATSRTRGGASHARLMNRFEEFLAAHLRESLYLADICAAIGTSERTLRASCQEHLGMGPIRYLWLRRMNLARRALLQADATRHTVTGIATRHGFWELGRFSVEYRALFGESPSLSLRRPPIAALGLNFADFA